MPARTFTRLRVAVVVGTRPEAIKLAPVVHEMAGRPAEFDPVVVSTGQHREMLWQAFDVTGIRPDVDLDLMSHDQGLTGFAAAAMRALDRAVDEVRPDVVLVQGDTTTVTMATLAGHYKGVRVGHVEAGLRSGDLSNPFPEEANRRVAGVLADHHFAPTERARQNLLREGADPTRVHVTGNTVVDALRAVRRDGRFDSPELEAVPFGRRRILLATSHRRENHGDGLVSICRALRRLAQRDDVAIVFPVHLSPRVRSVVHAELGDVDGVHLVDPLGYRDLVSVLAASTLVLSDSGGIQEEAPSFGVPVLILRETTERPEVLDVGAGVLVGTDTDTVVAEAERLLDNADAYRARSVVSNPFGDGRAAQRIADVLVHGSCTPFEAPVRRRTIVLPHVADVRVQQPAGAGGA